MRIEEAVSRYTATMARNRKLKPASVTAYKADLSEALRYLVSAGLEEVESVTVDHVQGFFAYLKNMDDRRKTVRGGRGDETTARRLRTLRKMFRWMVEKGDLKENPFSDWKIPQAARVSKERRYKSTMVTLEMVEAAAARTKPYLFGYSREWPPILRLRDAALLDVIRVTNAPVAEVARMESGDVNLAGKAVTVGAYTYPILKPTVDRLRRYMDASAPHRHGGTLWISLMNTDDRRGFPLTQRAIRGIIAETRDLLAEQVK